MSKPLITLTTCDSGDWEILSVDGKEFASGHRIDSIDWLGLLDSLDYLTEKDHISDEEMEERC